MKDQYIILSGVITWRPFAFIRDQDLRLLARRRAGEAKILVVFLRSIRGKLLSTYGRPSSPMRPAGWMVSPSRCIPVHQFHPFQHVPDGSETLRIRPALSVKLMNNWVDREFFMEVAANVSASCESFLKTLKRGEICANDYAHGDHLRTHRGVDGGSRQSLPAALGATLPFTGGFEQAATEAGCLGPSMSFFRHAEIYRPMWGSPGEAWGAATAAALPIVSMSFPLAIPRRVGLHQSPLPLRQL